MTQQDSLELLIKVQTQGQQTLTQLANVTKQVEDADKRATASSRDLEHQVKRTGDSMGGAVMRATLLAEGIMRVSGAVKTYVSEAAQYAARTEQVAAVMDNLSRVNGMNVQSVRMVADGIRDLGISAQESRNVINMMIGSQMDLSKSLELTRMAQNAAKVAGISSSEALTRMVYAISSAQPEMLRTLGIQVSFENAYNAAAKAMGKSALALTEEEKSQIRLQAVLKRSPLVDGSYVISLTTAAGQMQSLQRYTDDLKNALGQGLQPALFDIVGGMERLTKYAQENVEGFQSMATSLTALGVAGATFAALAPFAGPAIAGGAAVVAGVGTKILTDQDMAQANIDKYQDAFKRLDNQRALMTKQLETGLIDEEAFKRFSDQLPAHREVLRARFIEEQAALYKQRQQAFKGMQKPSDLWALTGDIGAGVMRPYAEAERNAQVKGASLAPGVSISAADIEAVIGGAPVKLDKSGLVANNPLLKSPPDTGDGGAAAKKAQQLKERIDRMVMQFRAYTMTELERFDAELQFQIADLVRDGATPGSIAALQSAAAGKRSRLADDAWFKTDSTLGELSAQRRSAAILATSPVSSMDNMPGRGAFIPGLDLPNMRADAVAALQRQVQFQEQLVRLTAGPGGEADAIRKISQLRLDAAQQEYDLSMKTAQDRAKLEASMDQARKDRVLQIAQLQQAELERYRQTAGQVYDAMLTKGMTGLGDIVKGQLQVVGRTIFQNLAVEVFRTAKDNLKLGDMVGGQVGKDGKLTGLGRVLQGTPFGVDQSKLVITENTNETRLNTQAIQQLTTSITTGGVGAGSGTSSLADAAGEILDKGGSKIAGKLQRVIGSALTIGAGAYGIASGIGQGGAKGGLNIAAGAASMASGLIGSKLFGASLAAGPWGAIAAGAGIGLSMLAGMFGQNKEKFDKEQTDTLNRNKYEAPTASNRVTDLTGSDVDYDFTGRLRTANERSTVIQFNVSAMDVKSFLDRSQDIAEALHKELRLGHRVGLDIQAAVLGV